MNPEAELAGATQLYARFSRRVSAIVADWMIAIAIIFGALALGITVQSDNFSRGLGVAVIAALLLYEPVLVSATGGTLGHYFTNLRVVDERGGNVSFLKACARVILKGTLGWFSFVIMAATRRNQAVHDLLTRSTVQIRDLSKAMPGQYITERVELEASNMPSRRRRLLVTGGYLLAALVIYLFAIEGIVTIAGLSNACVDNNYCSAVERMFSVAADITLLLIIAAIITLGWRGRLFGARKT
jgi:uncharacterized RDD family membrane protein YckC